MTSAALNPLAGIERRSFPRWSTRLIIRYGKDEPTLTGEGYDLSEGGLALGGPELYSVGSLLTVKFRLDSPLASYFTAKAIVRHLENDRMGVEFIDVGPADKARILEMIYRDIAMRRR